MKVTDEIQKPVDNGVEVGVEIISERLSGVRFVRGVGNDKYDGRIGGYDGEWMLSDTISVNDEITNPCIVGSVDEYNLVISNFDGDTFTFDMNTRQSKRVIEGSDTSMVLSCAFLKDGKIVCGRQCEDCTGDALTGCISVYDRKWVHINDVTIPTWVNVAVSKDGLIMAAEQFQSQIYHIYPINGKIVNTISCKEKLATLSGGLEATEEEEGHEEEDFFIHSFLSADVMTIVTDEELFITDGRDILWKQPLSEELVNAGTSAFIDPLTNDLYTARLDNDSKMCLIDLVVSGSGTERRVVSFPVSTTLESDEVFGLITMSKMIMTSSGKIIASDGENLLVFERRFSL